MTRKFTVGDRVEWRTSQGMTRGTIKKKVTGRTRVGGTELEGSEGDPVFIVESEKTDKHAGHKARALKSASEQARRPESKL